MLQQISCLRTLVNKKWGPSPTTILQINKQCVRPIFEHGCFCHNYFINKIQRVWNSIVRPALHLPEYVSACLIHKALGLPYVRERLITVGQNHLDRMHTTPSLSIQSTQLRPNVAWDKYKTPISMLNHQTDLLTPTTGCRKMR